MALAQSLVSIYKIKLPPLPPPPPLRSFSVCTLLVNDSATLIPARASGKPATVAYLSELIPHYTHSILLSSGSVSESFLDVPGPQGL